jgi:hypothetical protein
MLKDAISFIAKSLCSYYNFNKTYFPEKEGRRDEEKNQRGAFCMIRGTYRQTHTREKKER